VVTTARIYPLKGIDILLRAAALVHRRIPNVLFRIFGDVADKEYFALCERIIKENHLEGAVEFSRTNEPASVYNAAHMFCLSSISEGMPYSLIEAMFCGCPVVATDVGGVAEILGNTGIVVRPNDPDELANALLRVLPPEPDMPVDAVTTWRSGHSNARRNVTDCAIQFNVSIIYTDVFSMPITIPKCLDPEQQGARWLPPLASILFT
jgi:glycosyltransferase involved in cell wall biosynthesis